MVNVTEFREAKCDWCCKTDEGVQARFKEGLSGFLCKKCFWQRMKSTSTKEAEVAESSPGGRAA